MGAESPKGESTAQAEGREKKIHLIAFQGAFTADSRDSN